MKRFDLALTALLLTTVLVGACAPGGELPSASKDTPAQAALTRDLLTEADAVARRYEQDHLGHFIELKLPELIKLGLEVPDDFSVGVRATHTSYCIRATNRALPSIHLWRIATVTSKSNQVSTVNRCLV